MRARIRLLATFAAFAFSALAQINGDGFARELRAKYGPPLARETFAGKPGIEMVVDFAANGHVCMIQLPSVGPGREPGVKTTQAVDDFVAELVPLPLRGKELRRWSSSTGANSLRAVEYENVTLAESFREQTRTGVTLTFAKEQCAAIR
jgi:hypothetical protein